MTKSNQRMVKLRASLKSKENELLKEMDSESQVLEVQLHQGLKIAAIAGTVVASGFALYKLFGTKSTPSSKGASRSKKEKTIDRSELTQAAITMALHKLLPLIIDKISNKK